MQNFAVGRPAVKLAQAKLIFAPTDDVDSTSAKLLMQWIKKELVSLKMFAMSESACSFV